MGIYWAGWCPGMKEVVQVDCLIVHGHLLGWAVPGNERWSRLIV